jgi:hypothetical protein
MEADLALGPTPAVAEPAAAAMRRAGKLLGVRVQHLLNGSDPGRQAEALERPVHILPGRFETWEKRKTCCYGSVRHGVALLCGFDTPSLTAQGRQRLPSYFNIGGDIPVAIAKSANACTFPRRFKGKGSGMVFHRVTVEQR